MRERVQALWRQVREHFRPDLRLQRDGVQRDVVPQPRRRDVGVRRERVCDRELPRRHEELQPEVRAQRRAERLRRFDVQPMCAQQRLFGNTCSMHVCPRVGRDDVCGQIVWLCHEQLRPTRAMPRQVSVAADVWWWRRRKERLRVHARSRVPEHELRRLLRQLRLLRDVRRLPLARFLWRGWQQRVWCAVARRLWVELAVDGHVHVR